MSNIQKNPNAAKILTNWGLSLDSCPVSLVARTLPPEIVCFGNKQNLNQKTETKPMNTEWSREATLYPVIAPVDIANWVVLHTLKEERLVKVNKWKIHTYMCLFCILFIHAIFWFYV